MSDSHRALQPLQEAESAIAKLQDYESSAELASAVQATHAAVQRSLRYLLRSDKNAPDDLRLAAFSPSELSSDRLIPALRQREYISLDLAGQIFELEQAAKRAETDSVRASDADHALRVVDQLRTEITTLADKPVRDVAHSTVEAGALDEVHTIRADKESRTPMRLMVALLLCVLLAVLGVLVARKSDTEKGIALFEKQQYSEAEKVLRDQVEDDPGNALAAYYLAAIYRRSQRYDDAGRVLRRAIEKNPRDPFLREELGNLFMSANQPALAAKQYRLALESDPEEPRYWIKLVGALRNAGDPEAEAVLQRAPEEARAMLQSGR